MKSIVKAKIVLLLFVLSSVCVHLNSAVEVFAQSNMLQVYIGNQGNFSDVNGSLTTYSPSEGQAEQDVVMGLNTLVQSITVHENTGYIIGNTSDRIDVIDLTTNERIAQIRDVLSPRFMKVVSDEKAYVSNLFTATITVINLDNNSVGGTIAVGQNPETITLINENAFVANYGFGTADSTLSVIDVNTDRVVDTLQTGCDGPRFLEADSENDLWVFCNGKTVFNEDFTEIIEQTNGQVVVFDGETLAELNRIQLDMQAGASSSGQDAWYDEGSNQMFLVMGSSILTFDATTNTFSEAVEISGEESIGAVAYESQSGYLYLARITSFTTAGFVSIHDMTGMEMSRFDAGVAPAFIALYDPSTSTVSVEDNEPAWQLSADLDSAYPNPFSSRTSIPFTVNEGASLTLKVFNALGQEIAVLVDEYVNPGRYKVDWITEQPAGVYYYQLATKEGLKTRMLTHVK